ncbi:sulfatase family protein [Thalassoroseus pseudoceratinae]|uniref:sulfatase family protein n=1 Tax=Thalassoroseus pseudoceratinae TaxID=2713176 RepID=UPI001424369B|nr:sulfatase-like hydrolase/transferase [Thalassoroseus pseudoceratinae]
MKRNWRKLAASVSLLTVALVCSQSGLAADTPNFVLLMGDDHGWSETGYNGHPHLKTPVLDEMAKTGLQFDRFYAGHPTCSPTRGSFLTGRHPNRYGTFEPGYSIRPEEITIAHLLSSAGYRCAHFGKWHLGPVKAASPTNPREMGFQEYLSHDNFYEMNPIFSRNGQKPKEYPGEGSEVTIDETIKFIHNAKELDKPFLAVVWFGSPHEPYSGLEKDLALYADLPESYAKRTVRLTSMKTGRPTTRPLRDVLQERYAEITAMDRSIGTLRDYLKKSGLRENTMVFYCGDNGSPPSTDRVTTPFREDKASVYEGGIRVPGVIEWPSRIKKPSRTQVPAVTSDLLPTLCELVGVDVPERPIDGISLVEVLDGTMTERPKPIGFWQYDTQNIRGQTPLPEPYIDPKLQEGTTPLVKYLQGKLTRSFNNFEQPPIKPADFTGPRSFVHNRYKLVIDGEGNGMEVPELYDLVEDPAESKNIAESNIELTQKLTKELRDWQESVLNSVTGNDYPN